MKKSIDTLHQRNFPILIEKDEERFISHNLALDIASQGKTLEEAIFNIKEATQLYIEDIKYSPIKAHDYFLTSVSV